MAAIALLGTGDGPNPPTLALRGCVGEASASLGRKLSDIHVIDSTQRAPTIC